MVKTRHSRLLGLFLLLLLAGALSYGNPSIARPMSEIIQITDYDSPSPVGDRTWLSGNGRKVYFTALSGTGSELLVANADGSDTPASLGVWDYAKLDVSFDGHWLTIDSSLLFLDGSDITPVQELDCDTLTLHPVEAAISGNGRFVFIYGGGPWGCRCDEHGDLVDCEVEYPEAAIWRMPVGGDPVLWRKGDITVSDNMFASYDGNTLGYLSNYRNDDFEYTHSAIHIIKGGGNIRTLATIYPPSGEGWGGMVMSADGQWVVFNDYVDGVLRPVIMRTDGTGRRVVPLPDDMEYSGLVGLNEDGSRLFVEARDPGVTGLWLIDLETGAATRLISDLYKDGGSAESGGVSYDGDTISLISDGNLTGSGNYAYQVYVIKGPAKPDLTVDAFTLTSRDLTYSNGRFIMPLDVVVRNIGTAAVSTFEVRLSDNGGWEEDRTVAGLDVGGSTTLHLDWDLTDILKAGHGRATVRLTVVADPRDYIAEVSNLNNAASASTVVDVRPRITAVKPTFTLDKAYFLDDETVDNPVKVYVDWNGDLPGNGEAPYGDVYFDLNGTQVSEDGQSWGARHTYDMGRDFLDSFTCANNTLRIWATYPMAGTEFRSLDSILQPTVFPRARWVQWVIDHIPGSSSEFQTELLPPLVQYTYVFTYPEEPFEGTWTPPRWVPYMGGKELGILPTQASAGASAKSDGSGSAEVSGKTGLGLGAVDVNGAIDGRGETRFICGRSFDLQRAEMELDISTPINRQARLTDIVPGIRKAEKWKVVGRFVRWLNNVAEVQATFTPGVNIKTVFKEREDRLQFDNGSGTVRLEAEANLQLCPAEDVSLEVGGGGTPYLTLQVPKNPGYLQKVGIQLAFHASLIAWEFETEYEHQVNCSYPGRCEEEDRPQSVDADISPWHLIPRDYAGPDYAVPRYTACRTPYAPEATGTSTTTLLTNIYSRPEPALALRADGRRLLAYVHDDTSRPHGRGTEIYAFYWNGGSWNGPTRLTDDQQPDFAPVLAYDGSGYGVAVWERSALASGITPTLDITFAQSLEIAAATWSGTAWSAPITLTDNGLMDTAPQLSTGHDGTVMALWKTSDGEDILGTAAHPLTLTYALWDGSAWSTPAAALTGLHDVLDVAFAAYSSTQAALVYVVDADGEMTSTHDSDLYYSTFDGTGWSSPVALATDAITDTTPALAYDGTGHLHLLWLRGGDLVWLEDSWDVSEARVVREGSTEGGFLGFTLARAANGNLALVWQAMGEAGADLTYAIYDAQADLWGADARLTLGADVEAEHATAFGGDGNLYLAYRRVETDFVTRTFTISPTASFTVTNIPQPGRSDLVFLSHTVGRDLTFDSLTITPTNPAPGQIVTLTAVLRNAGDLAIGQPQVAFYDGAQPIVTRTLALTVAAGYTATVEVSYTLPATAEAHTFEAVADPAGQVAETDEMNNAIALQTTLPDLRIELLYGADAPTVITYTARLVNGGVLTATAPFTLALRAADPITGTWLGAAVITDDLAAGAQMTVTLALTEPLALAGLGTQVWATVDEGDVVAEADEGDNTAYAFLPLLPDLTLTAADIADGEPLTVTLHNAGVLTATAPTLGVWLDGLTGTLLYSATLGDIPPGGDAIVQLGHASSGELWVKADPDNRITESREGNNLAVREVTVSFRLYLPLVIRQD